MIKERTDRRRILKAHARNVNLSLRTLYSGQFTLSTHLIKPIYLVITHPPHLPDNRRSTKVSVGTCPSILKIDWPTDRPTDWLTDPLSDWSPYWLTDWLNDWLANWLTDWLTNWPNDWPTIWPTTWLTDWLTDWLSGQLTNWLSDCLSDWLVSCYDLINESGSDSNYFSLIIRATLNLCY